MDKTLGNQAKANALAYRMKAASGGAKFALAAEALAASPKFDEHLSRTIDAALAEVADQVPAWLEALPESVNTVYIMALAAGERSDFAAESAYWSRFFELHSGRDPFHLLSSARAMMETGDSAGAAAQLRLALQQPVRYAFFPRAERLTERIASAAEASSLRKARIAVLGSSTTSLLIPVLKSLCLRDRVHAEFYEGPYNSIAQQILDPQSGLAPFRPQIVVLAMHWRDLRLPVLSNDAGTVAQSVLEQQKTLWLRLSEMFGCHVVQYGFDFPAEDAYGYLSVSLPGGRGRVIEVVNRTLREHAPAFVSILDTARLQRDTGSLAWEDPQLWYRFRQHPSTTALPTLAEGVQAHIRAVLGLTRKVLVTDLDNTLWKGVIGEDGLNGIQIGPGSPAGEAHEALQRYMLDLKSRGILLAVCSKNNPADARLPFKKHPHIPLRMEDFAVFVANWQDKAENLRGIARRLSLGLDSFVFLDDNPLEREWVRSQLPQVAVAEVGASVFHFVRDLERAGYFFGITLSQEDLDRTAQYQTEAQRENLRASIGSIDGFLVQLQLEASVEPVSSCNLARVTQLANKTNQFNVTTQRYTEAQIEALAQRPGAWTGAFRLADRMGSYGLVGLLFCVPCGEREWEVETWLMSCRTLGRQMEKFMFDCMVQAAIRNGVKRIVGVYHPTEKNGLVAELYDHMGFSKTDSTNAQSRYVLEVPDAPPCTAFHIRDVSQQREQVPA